MAESLGERIAWQLIGVIDLAADIERVARGLKQGLLLRRSPELAHIIESASKIEKAARVVGMIDVELLEKTIGESHDAIDQLEENIGKAPPGNPRTRIEWVKKQVARIVSNFSRELDQAQDAMDRLAAQLKWQVPRGRLRDRIDWVIAQVRELQRAQGRR